MIKWGESAGVRDFSSFPPQLLHRACGGGAEPCEAEGAPHSPTHTTPNTRYIAPMPAPNAGRIPPADLEPGERHVLDAIAQHGWSGQIIPPDDQGPGFEYTAGLMARFNHPEVVVCGLPDNISHDLLWNVYRQIEQGTRYQHASRTPDLLEGYECHFLQVTPPHITEVFGYALWHHRHARVQRPFEALQLVWPDRHGRYPFDPDAAETDWSIQPLLGEGRQIGERLRTD